MSSSSTKSFRRRSPLATLDPLAIRELCELHPWDLGRLSAASGIDRSVLSHVFAGRRSLPQHAASTFLARLGLTPTGELNRDHLFVFQARSGNSPLLRTWLERLLPNGAEVVQLLQGTEVGWEADQTLVGWALFDGVTAVLVHGTPGVQLPVTGDKWPVLGDIDHAGPLLGTDGFPDRAEVVKIVSGVPNLEKWIVAHPGWESVKRAAAKKGLDPTAVLDLIADYQFPSGDGKTLFPIVRLMKSRRAG